MLYFVSDDFNCLNSGALNKEFSEDVVLNTNTLNIYRTWDNLKHAILNGKINNKESKYLAVYEITEEKDIFIEPVKLEYDEVVPNAIDTGEHWVYNGFSKKPYIIKVNNIKEGIFEHDVEDYSRKEHVVFYKKKDFLHFQWLCKKLSISMVKNIVSDGKKKVYHITYNIPKNKSVKSLWYFHNETLQNYSKRKII